MTSTRRLVTMFALVLTLAPGAARAVVTGQIFGPGSQSFPIAVPPLKNLGGDNDGALGKQFARADRVNAFDAIWRINRGRPRDDPRLRTGPTYPGR